MPRQWPGICRPELPSGATPAVLSGNAPRPDTSGIFRRNGRRKLQKRFLSPGSPGGSRAGRQKQLYAQRNRGPHAYPYLTCHSTLAVGGRWNLVPAAPVAATIVLPGQPLLRRRDCHAMLATTKWVRMRTVGDWRNYFGPGASEVFHHYAGDAMAFQGYPYGAANEKIAMPGQPLWSPRISG